MGRFVAVFGGAFCTLILQSRTPPAHVVILKDIWRGCPEESAFVPSNFISSTVVRAIPLSEISNLKLHDVSALLFL
jgi:hypothetical protein